MRYYATRRSYGAPSVYLAGGVALGGMDASGSENLGASVGLKAYNLWRKDESVCKRPGVRLKTQTDMNGAVLEDVTFQGIRLIHFIREGVGYLRRIRKGISEDRVVATPMTILLFGEKLLCLSPGEWLLMEGGKARLISAEGTADITEKWSKTVSFSWSLSSPVVTVPLVRSGTSPAGKGVNVQAPNLLTPLRQESFVYTQSDKEKHRNRFCLAFAPVVNGELPTLADGTHLEITDAQKAVRKATLAASAKLEVRLLKTDAYGNSVPYWAKRSFSYADNISATDAAFWIQNIHDADLAYDGDDNVRITYFSDQDAGVLGADVYALYGIAGRKDRLFAAKDGKIYYSGMDDPLYFSKYQYLCPDAEGVNICILSGEDTVLTALTDKGAWRITGGAETSIGEYAVDAYFTLSARLPCPKPRGRKCVIAGGELLFYSEEGLCAITPSGVLDERCVQIRSARLSQLLEQEEDVCLHAWKNWVFLGGKNGIYLLDVERRVKGDTYSSHGYEAYFWPGIVVDSFGGKEELLFYQNGNEYCLSEGSEESDFHDEFLTQNGLQKSAIFCLWQSGRLGAGVHNCQRFFALSLHTDGRTSCSVTAGEQKLLESYGYLSSFAYSRFYYGGWNYHKRAKDVRRFLLPVYHKRGLRLCIANDVYDQPFALKTFILEYK